MTVGELADWLATQPRDRTVILARDAEGNGFSPLAEAQETMYDADSSYSGDTYPTPEVLATLVAEPGSPWSDDDAAPDSAIRAVLLCPAN